MLPLLGAPAMYSVLGVIFLAAYIVYRAALPKPIAGIPYHRHSATRILGDLPDLLKHKQRVGTFHDWISHQGVKLNSPVYQLFLRPFSKPAVYITDPRETQDILLRRLKDFDRSKFFQDIFSGTVPNNHIIQPTNEKFRQGVRLIADTMATPFLNGVAAPLIHMHSLNLMELWMAKSDAASGRPFWAADDLILFSFDAIWDIAFGSKLDSLPEATAFIKTSKFNMPTSKDDPIDLPNPPLNTAANSMAIVALGINVTVPSLMPRQRHWLLRMTPSYRRAKIYNDRLVQTRLEDAKARLLNSTHETTDDLTEITCATDLMVRRESQAARKENRPPRYDSNEAKDELFGFLVGGFDTTAVTLKWSLKILGDNPRVQSKLRRALYDAFGQDNGVPSAEKFTTTRTPYLDAVVEELIRCSQTTSAAVRTAVRDTQLLGHHIPKGVDVFMMSNGPGYMTSNDINERIPEGVRSKWSQENKDRAIPNWDSSDIGEFKPERWIKTDENGNETFDARAGPSMQFGAGLRACFGKKLVYLKMRIVIAVLLWTFELQPPPEKLRGYEATENLARRPVTCYVRLKKTGST
ncbi:hypothetical protein DL763_000640 [Monosporascus cannonballus]|nr:hypothetical protein DL763_000640 [Monosporascus cannonballus]